MLFSPSVHYELIYGEHEETEESETEESETEEEETEEAETEEAETEEAETEEAETEEAETEEAETEEESEGDRPCQEVVIEDCVPMVTGPGGIIFGSDPLPARCG